MLLFHSCSYEALGGFHSLHPLKRIVDTVEHGVESEFFHFLLPGNGGSVEEYVQELVLGQVLVGSERGQSRYLLIVHAKHVLKVRAYIHASGLATVSSQVSFHAS